MCRNQIGEIVFGYESELRHPFTSSTSPFLIFLLQSLIFYWECFSLKIPKKHHQDGNSYYGVAKCCQRMFFIQISEHFHAYFRLHWPDHSDLGIIIVILMLWCKCPLQSLNQGTQNVMHVTVPSILSTPSGITFIITSNVLRYFFRPILSLFVCFFFEKALNQEYSCCSWAWCKQNWSQIR